MELFRVGESLLRSPTPLLPFLAPAFRRSVARHAFSTCSTRRNERDEINDLLDGALGGTKGTGSAPATRTSNYKSSTAQQEQRSSRFEPRPMSSTDEMIAAMRPSSPNYRSSASSRSNQGGGFSDITSLLDSPNFGGLQRPNSNLPAPPLLIPKPLPFTLSPSVGRAVNVIPDRGMDIGRAFKTLEIQCNKNSVKRDFMRQRFHERPGLKRKRLRQERWRRRFRENFRGVVQMVQGMRAQGW
ncbi:hypothetical protein LTR22_006724 [Elasticomyces elasticus]|nr:hypothetical protein LTR22_006724 [Elasticomyces elasticus]KAK4926434.1 hypothetical protein LTR49_006641 [Elasticomyces elasticus]KAK5761193.1 hypothetical protein LTS12_008674 [Elasticomyces elasticus]